MSRLPKHIQLLFKTYLELDTSREDGEYYGSAIGLLENFLQSIQFETEQLPIPESIAGKPNRVHLIARRQVDPSLPTLLIYNHIDVVPATYPNAFSFVENDGQIFARGSSDHKGSTIAVLWALEALHSTKVRFNIIFIATTDEETDQMAQLEYLSPHLKLPENTLIFDPDTMAGGITVAHLGISQLEIMVHGKACHSAASHLGINAVEQSSQVIHFLTTVIKTNQESQQSSIASFPTKVPAPVVSRCNVNQISGGTAPNVVADFCTITVDVRFIPEVNVAEATEKIIQQIKQFSVEHSIDLGIKIVTSFEGFISQHAEIDRLEKVHQEIEGESGQYCVMGSTPAAHWAKQLGLPHFGLGVARMESNIHGVDEHVEIADIVTLKEVFEKFLV